MTDDGLRLGPVEGYAHIEDVVFSVSGPSGRAHAHEDGSIGLEVIDPRSADLGDFPISMIYAFRNYKAEARRINGDGERIVILHLAGHLADEEDLEEEWKEES